MTQQPRGDPDPATTTADDSPDSDNDNPNNAEVTLRYVLQYLSTLLGPPLCLLSTSSMVSLPSRSSCSSTLT
jgi:hypothetical protein